MGPYLAKPETTIHSSNDENDRFICCTAEMQGWRKTQEDAHSALLNYDDKGSAFFAVFDGHGGEEVSKYCALHFPAFLKRSLYQDQNIKEAIKKSFLEFDRTLKEQHVISELRRLASLEDIDDDETSLLKKEAQMPLEQLINDNLLEVNSKDAKNGESSKDAGPSSSNSEDGAENARAASSTEGDKTDSSSDKPVVVKKNGEAVAETAGNLSNGEESNGEGSSKSSALLEQPSSSGTSISPGKSAKSLAMKVLNHQIYEAFLKDYGSDDDDDEDEEEVFGESDSEDDEEEEDDDEDDDECADSDEDDTDNIFGLPDPFGNAYIAPGVGSGCTAIVAIVRGNLLYVANVGDSRCVLSREGTAIEMSEDHKPEDEQEKNRIVNAGGEVTTDGRVNGGLNLSRAIGDHLYKKNEKLSDVEQMVTALPDIRTHEIDAKKDQFMVLACDGIWNSMTSQEVVDFINERMQKDVDLKTICEELFNACLAPNSDGDGSGCDNMTCVLIKFKKGGENKRPLEVENDDAAASADHSEPDQKKTKTNDETTESDLCKPGSSRA